jgi:ascorbate-specific PTS system EIIC-type component UlaA
MFKQIHLAGHVMMGESILANWFTHIYLGMSGWDMVIVSSIWMALLWTLWPWVWWKRTYPKVTGPETNISLGHGTGTGAYIWGSYVAPLLGKTSSAEELKLPGILEMFADNTVNTSIVMTLFFTTMCLLAGPTIVQPQAGATNWLVWSAAGCPICSGTCCGTDGCTNVLG